MKLVFHTSSAGPAPTLRDWLEAHDLPMFKVDHFDVYIRQECLSASRLAELLGHQSKSPKSNRRSVLPIRKVSGPSAPVIRTSAVIR
jgi:hypothetical protein